MYEGGSQADFHRYYQRLRDNDKDKKVRRLSVVGNDDDDNDDDADARQGDKRKRKQQQKTSQERRQKRLREMAGTGTSRLIWRRGREVSRSSWIVRVGGGEGEWKGKGKRKTQIGDGGEAGQIGLFEFVIWWE
jgi:hypothetical protein